MTLATELKQLVDTKKEEILRTRNEQSALYWMEVKGRAYNLLPEVKQQCKEAAQQGQIRLHFGHETDRNIFEKLSELLEEEEVKTEIRCYRDDLGSYYQLEITW